MTNRAILLVLFGVVMLVLVGDLLYVAREDRIAAGLAADVNASGSLRFRALWIYSATREPSIVGDWQPVYAEMHGIVSHVEARYPTEVHAAMAGPWRAFSLSLAREGRIDWQTAEGMRRAAHGLTNDLEARAIEHSRRTGRIAISGVGSLMLFLPLVLLAMRRLEGAEKTLQRERDFTRAVIGTTSSLVVVLRPDGRVVEVNPAAERLTGWKNAEVQGRPFWEVFLAPEDVAPVRDAFGQLTAGDFPNEYENAWITRTGERRCIAWSNTAVVNADGTVCLVVGIGLDATERKRTEEALGESEALFAAFMDHSPALAFMKDAQGRMVYVNRTMEKAFGLSRAELYGRTDADWLPPEAARGTMEHDQAVLASGQPTELVETVPKPDGEERHWLVHKFPYANSRGERFLGGLAVDITERKRAEDALHESEAFARSLVESRTDCVEVLNSSGRMVWSNEKGCDLPRLAASASADGELWEEVWLPEAQADARSAVADALGGETSRFEGVCVQGTWWEVVVSPLYGGDGAVKRLLCVSRDVTVRKDAEVQLAEAHAELARVAALDGLTGLPNRRVFEERLTAAFEAARNDGSPLSLLFVDVDQFKGYNDSFGHPEGDAALRTVATLLQRGARPTDLVARYGGEEFVLVLPGADAASAVALAERLRESIAVHPWAHRAVTASFGVDTLTPGAGVPDVLVAQADKALYASKRDGRDRVTHAADLRQEPTTAWVSRPSRRAADATMGH